MLIFIADVILPVKKIEEIKKRINGRTSAPNHPVLETDNDLLIVLKPFKRPDNLSACLKNPLMFVSAEARLSRHKRAIASAQKYGSKIKDLLLPQTFIICHAKDGTLFIVKITEFRQRVRSMAEMSFREIYTNRACVEAMAKISIFGLTQLVFYGRKYDLIAGTKKFETPAMGRQFVTTLKPLNVFSGINPKTGKVEIFIDADWFTYVCETKSSATKAMLNALLWLRNAFFYYLLLLLHSLKIFRQG